MARSRNVLEYVVTPLPAVWPGVRTAKHDQKHAPFKTPPLPAIHAELAREVRMLGGTKVEIAVDVRARDLRNDGMLKADARPMTPAVMLSFIDGSGQRHAYPADLFTWWEDNLSAVARSLEALRMVERYGIQSRLIRAGFKALPGSTDATISTLDAAKILADVTGFAAAAITSDPIVAKDASQRAMSKAHPDRHAGDRSLWDKVEAARSILSGHHSISL